MVGKTINADPIQTLIKTKTDCNVGITESLRWCSNTNEAIDQLLTVITSKWVNNCVLQDITDATEVSDPETEVESEPEMEISDPEMEVSDPETEVPLLSAMKLIARS